MHTSDLANSLSGPWAVLKSHIDAPTARTTVSPEHSRRGGVSVITMAEIGLRVRQAREAIGMPQAEVARGLGINRSSLSRIESGERAVSAVEIGRLARMLDRSPSYLLGATQAAPEALVHGENVGPGDQAPLVRFLDHCEEYASLERLVFGEPSDWLPSYGARRELGAAEQGEELAREERSRLGLGSAAVRDMVAVIEEQGVKLYAEFAPESRVMGAFHSSDDLGPCVFVNQGAVETRPDFSAAHEYCHLLVDRETIGSYACLGSRKTGSRPFHEIRADSFAAAFLMPREAVEALARRYGVEGVESVVHLQRHFGTSYEAVLRRLGGLDLIDEAKGKQLSEARHSVVDRLLGGAVATTDGASDARENVATGRRFRLLALGAFRQGRISGGKLAEVLGLSREEALELVGEIGEDTTSGEAV